MRETLLTPLEDATLQFVLAHAAEGDGWLDLTGVCSRTGRMLPDVRDAVHALVRRRLLVLDDKARHTPRWMRFLLPAPAKTGTPPASIPIA